MPSLYTNWRTAVLQRARFNSTAFRRSASGSLRLGSIPHRKFPQGAEARVAFAGFIGTAIAKPE
jgi:hypothetical protein